MSIQRGTVVQVRVPAHGETGSKRDVSRGNSAAPNASILDDITISIIPAYDADDIGELRHSRGGRLCTSAEP